MPNIVNRIGRTETTLVGFILLIVIVFTMMSPYFLTASNMVDVIDSSAVMTIFATGVFVVLLSGGIDISFAAIAAVSQYAGAYLAARMGLPMVPTLAVMIVSGVLLGALNAVLIHFLRVASIIVTIATSSIYFASLLYFIEVFVPDSSEIYDLPAWWTDKIWLVRYTTDNGDLVRIGLPILVTVIIVVFTHFLVTRTRIGRQIYAVGGSADSAQRIGISVLSVQLFVYSYLGLLSAIAGYIYAHRMSQAVPSSMVGTELNVLAVAVLGGASLAGGVGSMGGVILGILLLGLLQNGLNLVGVSSYFFQVVIGLVILVSVSATAWNDRRVVLKR